MQALQSRVALWDGVLAEIQTAKNARRLGKA